MLFTNLFHSCQKFFLGRIDAAFSLNGFHENCTGFVIYHPFAGAAVSKVLDIFEEQKILEHVQDISGYLRKRLEELKTEFPCITERRGRGLMQGLELISSVPAGEISAKALQQGLILITAGNNVRLEYKLLLLQNVSWHAL